MARFREKLSAGKEVAFVIKKGALTDAQKVEYNNDNVMICEEIIRHVVAVSKEGLIISTTVKASRERFENSAENGQSHKYDFLTVGSMGHCSSIALGVAINKTDKKIWCIYSDGSVLMHMKSIAVLGVNKPKIMIYIVINNNAHETVGGMQTVAGQIDLVAIAEACGYPNVICVDNYSKLIENWKRQETSMN